jgi:hypothetical protein
MDKRFMVLLQPSFLKEENHTDETLNLSRRVSFQLVHPSLDDQENPFMGCDCHIELVFKAWKSGLHLATLTSTTKHSTLCYLYGRMLLIVLTFALCPSLRAVVWQKQQREMSLLKLVRHFQASADQWLQALFQSGAQLAQFLARACTAAERLVTKAVRKRPTSAQSLRNSLEPQLDFFEPTLALAA